MSRWRQAAQVAQVDSGDRVVLLGLSHLAEHPRVLADSGAVIWRLLAEPASEDELIGSVAEAYDVEPAVVAADVTAFVADLHGLGLLESVED
jgi:Coenzyme PQQ synthesis protein D (PqqD)